MKKIKLISFMIIISTLIFSACFGSNEINTDYNCVISAFANQTTYGTVEGGGTYKAYSNVSLKAVPRAGHHFIKWSDGSTANPYKFVIAQDISITAIFETGEFAYVGDNKVITYEGTLKKDSNSFLLTAFDNDTFVYWYQEGEDYPYSMENPMAYYFPGSISADIVFKVSRRLEGYGVYVVKNINDLDYLINPSSWSSETREKTKERLNNNYNAYFIDSCEITANSTNWDNKDNASNSYYFNKTLNYNTSTSYYIIYKFFKYENDETVKAYPVCAFEIESPQTTVGALKLPLNGKTYFLNVNFHFAG